MLTQCSDQVAAFFGTLGVLQQSLHNSLLELLTTSAFTICNLDQALKDTLDRQRLRFAKCEALFFLCLEGYITRVSVLVVERLESRITKSTDLLERF